MALLGRCRSVPPSERQGRRGWPHSEHEWGDSRSRAFDLHRYLLLRRRLVDRFRSPQRSKVASVERGDHQEPLSWHFRSFNLSPQPFSVWAFRPERKSVPRAQMPRDADIPRHPQTLPKQLNRTYRYGRRVTTGFGAPAPLPIFRPTNESRWT